MSFKAIERDPLSVSLVTSKNAVDGDKVEFLLRVTGSSSSRGRTNVVYVIDASKSMDGERLFFAKHAAIKSLDLLDVGDGISIIKFCRTSEIVFGPAKLEGEETKRNAIRSIAKIKTCPGTNIEAALIDAIVVAKNMISSYGGVGVIVLITDGEPNYGEKDPQKLKDAVKKYVGGAPITVTTIGVGSDYNERLLVEIAKAKGGVMEHVSDVAEMDKPVTREVLRASKIVAANVQVIMKSSLGTSVRVYGWDYEEENDKVVVNVGSVAASEVVELPGEVFIEDAITSLDMEVRVSYTDPLTQRTSWRGPLLISLPVGEPTSINDFVIYKVKLFKSFEDIKRALEKRDYKRALELIASAAETTLTLGDTSLHERTVDIASLLEKGMLGEASKRLFSLATEALREREE